MSEVKLIRKYGNLIDRFRGVVAMEMPLLPTEQAVLCRAIKSLSTCHSLMAQKYVRAAENLLAA